MPTFKSTGFVLKRFNYREYDKIFTVYTREHGKVNCIASGVRKIKSKHAGHLEPFTQAMFMFANGRGQLPKLATSSAMNTYPSMRKNLSTIALGNFCIEIIDRAILEQQQDEVVYEYLAEVLELLDAEHSVAQKILISRAFGFKLLSYLGYKPELLSCLLCKKPVSQQETVFHSLLGGLIEMGCLTSEHRAYALPINHEVTKILSLILDQTLSHLMTVRIAPEALFQLSQIIKVFLETHLERPLTSHIWLEKYHALQGI